MLVILPVVFFNIFFKNSFSQTFGQDGGVGRHIVPHHTIERRTTTNLKTKNNQNWQKIELYGSPTTKELKKKHSYRLVWGVEMGSWVERTWGKVEAGELGQARWRLEDWVVLRSCADTLGGTTGERYRPRNPGFQCGEIKPESLWLKAPVGVEAAARGTPRLTGEFIGKTHRVLEHTQTHPPGNQHWKGTIWLWVAGEVTENWQRARASAPVTSQTPFPHTASQGSNTGCPALVNT